MSNWKEWEKEKVQYICPICKEASNYVKSPDVFHDHGCPYCLNEFFKLKEVKKYLSDNTGTCTVSENDKIDIDTSGCIVPSYKYNELTEHTITTEIRNNFYDIVAYVLMFEMSEQNYLLPKAQEHGNKYEDIKNTMHLNYTSNTVHKIISEFRKKYKSSELEENKLSNFHKWMER